MCIRDSDMTMSNVKFLPDVIKYDRYQPEFYEDTKTYISKRASSKKVSKGISFYKENSKLINTIETQYNIEKELLLALMGIETNFGTYVGKMDILSSLATLSFDKRRSEFFSNELLTLLRLIETNQIDYKTLYGSWAGAFGYFQFMPSTMKNYAIDYDNNNYIGKTQSIFFSNFMVFGFVNYFTLICVKEIDFLKRLFARRNNIIATVPDKVSQKLC